MVAYLSAIRKKAKNNIRKQWTTLQPAFLIT